MKWHTGLCGTNRIGEGLRKLSGGGGGGRGGGGGAGWMYEVGETGKQNAKELTLTINRNVTDYAVCLFVGWLLNVPATCECISGTDLHRQVYVLPH